MFINQVGITCYIRNRAEENSQTSHEIMCNGSACDQIMPKKLCTHSESMYLKLSRMDF